MSQDEGLSESSVEALEIAVGLRLSWTGGIIIPTEEQGLLALWEEPELYPLAEHWAGPYTDRKIQTDPWGSPFRYVCKDSVNGVELPKGLPFGIISLGADRAEGGEGNDSDIRSWE